MKNLFDLVFRLGTATLLLLLINVILKIEIPYHWFNIVMIALFETKGILIILALYYFW